MCESVCACVCQLKVVHTGVPVTFKSSIRISIVNNLNKRKEKKKGKIFFYKSLLNC